MAKTVNKKPIALKEVKVVASKKPVSKKDDGKKPIALKEVVVSAKRKPSLGSDTTSKAKPRKDTIGVGYSEMTSMSPKELKGMVKKYNLKSVDTTNVSTMRRTAYGSNDMKNLADAYLASKKKGK
jgi:dihydroorotase